MLPDVHLQFFYGMATWESLGAPKWVWDEENAVDWEGAADYFRDYCSSPETKNKVGAESKLEHIMGIRSDSHTDCKSTGTELRNPV